MMKNFFKTAVSLAAAAAVFATMSLNVFAADYWDKQDNKEVSYRDNFSQYNPDGVDLSTVDSSEVKAQMWVEKVTVDETAAGTVVPVNVYISGAENQSDTLAMHLAYDSRLEPVEYSRYGDLCKVGDALSGFMAFDMKVVDSPDITFQASSRNKMKDGTLFTVEFRLPDNAKNGDLYPVCINYRELDTFWFYTPDDDPDYESKSNRAKLMNAWLWMNGCTNGYIKVETEIFATTITNEKYVASVKSTESFYLSTEEEFHKNNITDFEVVKQYDVLALDKNGDPILDANDEPVYVEKDVTEIVVTDIADITYKNATPKSLYDERTGADGFKAESIDDFKYEVELYWNDEPLQDAEGETITVDVYIGLKGDVTLDGKVDSRDAQAVLAYSTVISSGMSPNAVKLTKALFVEEATDIADSLAAFLGDVANEPDKNNCTTFKNKRLLDTRDAQRVLEYSTLLSSGSPDGAETWKKVGAN